MSKSGWRGSYRQRQRIKRELAAVERVCWLGLEPLNFEQTDRTAGDFVVIDEEIPCAKGGDPLDISNCHLTCNRHNLMKGARILPRGYFAQAKPRETSTSRRW